MKKLSNKKAVALLLCLVLALTALFTVTAFADTEPAADAPAQTEQTTDSSVDSAKAMASAIAIGVAAAGGAIGMGMAVPHAKSDAVKQAGLAAITVPDGIDCRALDGQPTRLLFMIAAPDDGDLHLQILSSLMTLLVEEERRERLVQAATPEAFLAELEAAEA